MSRRAPSRPLSGGQQVTALLMLCPGLRMRFLRQGVEDGQAVEALR